MATTLTNTRPTRSSSATSAKRPGSGRARAERENVRAWTFQSAGPKKYAVQIQKASNGNPCLRLVEGTPVGDGTFRKFDVTIWSEDFAAFFEMLDQVRAYIAEHDVRTPAGHRYDPSKKPRRAGGTPRGSPARTRK